MSQHAAARRALPGPQGALPSGLLSRVPLPTDLVDAIAGVLEREAFEEEVGARAALLAEARATLEAWLSGAVSTEEAISKLVAAAEPRSGIVAHPGRSAR